MRTPAIVLAVSLSLYSQPADPKRTQVDHIFAGFNTHTPGCAVGVAQNGAVVLTAGYGMADLERNVAITSQTIFESGSVAKQFTAAALMLLAQQGKISLDDPMRKYLPELPDYGAPLTIRHVLSHVSGLREWRPIATFGGMAEGTFVYSNQDLLQMASQQKALNFDPGTNYSYTNTGFNISTILIERVTGKSFQQFTHEVIFAPLDMQSTQWREDFRKIIPRRALAYGRGPDGALTQQTPIENIIGAGGLLTTVDDLLKWNENFTHANVGGLDFVKAQQTPATLTAGRTITYAAGLSVSSHEGVREVSHSGATGGYRTWLGRYPDQGVSVAVLCNSAQANPTALAHDTARLWTGTKAISPTETVTADPSRFLGMYRRLRDNTVTDLHVKDGKLLFGPFTELLAIGPKKFRARTTAAEFTFDDRLHVTTPTDDVLYERVEPVQPTAADLQALAGSYESKETGSTVIVTANGKLTYRIGLHPSVELKPTFRDTFTAANGEAIHFIRDTTGRVTAFSAGEDRVWDLRFTKTR